MLLFLLEDLQYCCQPERNLKIPTTKWRDINKFSMSCCLDNYQSAA
jgi:hypothetical protein